MNPDETRELGQADQDASYGEQKDESDRSETAMDGDQAGLSLRNVATEWRCSWRSRGMFRLNHRASRERIRVAPSFGTSETEGERRGVVVSTDDGVRVV